MSTGLWRNGDFVKMWSGQAIALVGQQFSVLAFPLTAVLTLDASPSAVALLVASASYPSLFLGLFVGVLIDRFRRRPVIIISNVGRAVLMLSVPATALFDALSMAQLVVVAFLVGTLDICFMTAYRSYVPTVVPKTQLTQAYSLVGASDGVTRTAAPSLAGGAIQLLGAPIGLGVTALCYVSGGLFNWRIKKPEPPRSEAAREPIWSAFREGLLYTWRHSIVRAFALSDATYLFFWSFLQSILLVFLTRNLDMSPGTIGLIFTLGTLGGLAAAFVARRIGNRIGVGRSIVLGSLLRSAGMAIVPLVVFFGPLALLVLVFSRLVNSFGWTLWEVHQETTQQLMVPDRIRARVNGSSQFLAGTALALGPSASAAVVAMTGVIPTLTVGALGTLLAIIVLLTKPLRTLYEEQTATAASP